MNIEFAAAHHRAWQVSDPAKVATRHAPVHIKTLIDRSRFKHGLPPLWPGAVRASETRNKAKALQDCPIGVLIGTCTAGTGVPTSCGYDRHHLPEVFQSEAFRHSVEQIKAGKASAWISLGHSAEDVGTTDDGRLHVWVDRQVGLMFQLRLLNTDDHRQLAADARMGLLGVSVGFQPRRMTTRKLKGKSIRVIQEAVLSHIGLCRKGQMDPAFKSNRVIHSWAKDEVAMDAAMTRASLGAWLAHRASRQ